MLPYISNCVTKFVSSNLKLLRYKWWLKPYFCCNCLQLLFGAPSTVHGVAKSRTQLSDITFTFHFHALEKEMALQYSCLESPRDRGAW